MAEDIIKGLIKKYSKDIIMLDGLLQWALNPTSMSAGYGIEENYPYIEKNLRITYELTSTESEKVIKSLKKDCNEFIKVMKNENLYDMQKLIIKEISQPQNIKLFEKFLFKRKKRASEMALRFLHIYKNSPIKDFFFLNVQYNAIYGDELKNEELIRLGILKILYWISSGKTRNREEQPKFIPFLDLIINRVKLKKWKPPKYDIKAF